eukprot:GFYU01000930.1.p1 GENE.GFYU01000930.1~~GFYU01000930.1.p1  ORF type:complete len:310 (+),score=85.78 GFYU01000930.1:156-1085(+)
MNTTRTVTTLLRVAVNTTRQHTRAFSASPTKSKVAAVESPVGQFVYKSAPSRPLAMDTADIPVGVVMGWMGSQPKHLTKYEQLFHAKGIDTVTYQPTVSDVLFPDTASERMQGFIERCSVDADLKDRRLALHTFSTGAYLYSVMMDNILENSESSIHRNFSEMVVGSINDSSVDWDQIPFGLPTALTGDPNSPVRKLMTACIHGLFYVSQPITVKHRRMSELFHQNALRKPGLFLYSEDDIIAPADRIREVMGKWEAQGDDVSSVSWAKSRHVTHLKHHPQEYSMAVSKFLDKHLDTSYESLEDELMAA